MKDMLEDMNSKKVKKLAIGIPGMNPFKPSLKVTDLTKTVP